MAVGMVLVAVAMTVAVLLAVAGPAGAARPPALGPALVRFIMPRSSAGEMALGTARAASSIVRRLSIGSQSSGRPETAYPLLEPARQR